MFKLLLILPFFVSLTAIAAPVGSDGLLERKLRHKGGAGAGAVAATPTSFAATGATPAAVAAGEATQAAVAAANNTPTDFANSVATACTNLDISALAFGNPDEPDATLNPCSFFANPFPCTTDPDRATQLNLSLCPPGTPINVNPGTVGTVGNVAGKVPMSLSGAVAINATRTVTAAPGSTACTPFTPDTASIAALGDADLPPCATVTTPFQCTNDQGRATHLFLTSYSGLTSSNTAVFESGLNRLLLTTTSALLLPMLEIIRAVAFDSPKAKFKTLAAWFFMMPILR
ncbi:hypothetical protein DFH08DRAFT_809325 [Mycena albidolilacea]|uniref:Uncharacterized protein n=1 Tax=Mycena albidolilacea TaxID=1033008 RepID=A0AAD7A1G0_9AGAR|nr:hypothetical protein DFH08DRAFT_809325 [Mycena albidolilacea]